MNRHPGQAEADAVRATYKEKTCSYGDDCQTEGCLYWHPYEEHEVVENAAEYTTTGEGEQQQLSAAMGGLHLDSSGTLTYEQWLAYNCPSPPTMDENEVYKAWYYPGSGMQRDPWEVYCLMYPQNYNSTASGESNNGGLNATSQTWQPLSAAPQSWEPATNTNYQQQQQAQNTDPQSFQEWKKRGQPNPSWFSSYINIDPWYDDEGMRRDLEEVYEVLYGPNAEEKFAQKKYEQEIANDPTPAELAAMINSKEDVQLGTSPVVKDTTPAKSGGGWASIAAKPPAPVSKPTATTSGGRSRSNSNASSSGKGEALSANQKSKMVVIPKEVWLPSTANSDCFHLFPNPIERFKAVNSHHKSYLASVTIPLCFDNNKNTNSIQNSKGGSKVTLLDVHFQSAKTITPVLNRFLVPALKKNDEVWIVTGSGHHVAVGHQKREGGGVLFNAVKRYLEDHGDEMEMRIGKDTSGGKNKNGGGAFLVRHRTT